MRRAFRVALAIAGAGALAFAAVVDRSGWGTPGTVGMGQTLLGLFGAVALAAALLGGRFPALYRDVSTLAVSSLLLLAFLELVAIVIDRIPVHADLGEIRNLSYYAARSWTDTYWREVSQADRMRYEPYEIWRHRPFDGETLKIDEAGLRHTPGADCREGAYRLFAFGGSTLHGWGSPDWGTIPAFLQRGLDARRGALVCVVNLGEHGFVSTQGTIALLRRLRAGDVPDAVLFYDGVNEILAAAETGQAGVHVTLETIASRFEQREHPLLTWIERTRLYRLASRIGRDTSGSAGHHRYRHPDVDPHALGRAAARRYLGNHRVVRALGDRYGFPVFFFVQPHLAVTRKPLTEEERPMRTQIGGSFERLARSFYEAVRGAAPDRAGLWDVSGVFDHEEALVWIDATGHLTPYGNRLVAEAILEHLGSTQERSTTRGDRGSHPGSRDPRARS